ncbi:SPOSA6832_03991 [Sporobolomyces salmonicolor]|uniref:argininosuccinate lyase n=1 Tax=Sporidiobolus salmonicolor TaxID=5005 RepID=A0A0D6EQB4_SPOSA|nr:SPOSA6832_03991 [Sporobolomyces salmonicolor]
MAEQMAKKLWGGRFTSGTDPLMWEFNQCLSYDKALYAVDVAGSKAYALALSRTTPPILTAHELSEIHRGLDQVKSEWESGAFVIKQDDEDIHTANERRLSEIIGGDIGGKLHTGRSRNDQVATDMRLWLIQEVSKDIEWIQGVVGILSVKAEEWIDHLAAGFTHLQRAQPIRFSHFLLAHAHSFAGDLDRFRDLLPRVSTLPLGSGALAGNPFCVDRELLRSELGMQNIGGNSMQSVADRDFVAEYLFACSLLMVHISRLAEDLIIYSSSEFSWVVCGDAYRMVSNGENSTGSSIMPQKKNPDALELLRGKSGRTIGQLTGFLTTLKGLPATYNKDLQESQEPMFDAAETIGKSLRILQGVISTLKVRCDSRGPSIWPRRVVLGLPVRRRHQYARPTKIFPENMRKSLTPDMLATDLAEYLVRKGIPFRETHHISGSCIRLSEETHVPLSELTLEQFQSVSPHFSEDVKDVFNFETSVERRDAKGGTSRRAVMEQIENLKKKLVASAQ